MITDAELAEWKRLGEAASPGPWESESSEYGTPIVSGGASIAAVWPRGLRGPEVPHAASGAFIAAARTAVPALIAEVEGLRAEMGRVLDMIHRYGGIEGEHHKQWVLDQVVRGLTGNMYPEWVRIQKDGADGPDSYAWSEGVPP